jgi:hypothetical protein
MILVQRIPSGEKERNQELLRVDAKYHANAAFDQLIQLLL